MKHDEPGCSMRFFPNWARDSGVQFTGLMEMIWYVRHRCKAEVWCEIGSYIGESALIIGSFPFVKKIHCVDKFDVEERKRQFDARIEHLRYKVEVHACRSEDFYEKIPKGSLDVVYIDGDHSYETTMKDLNFAFEAVRDGGFICGHDYVIPEHKGVFKAVNEFVLEKNLGMPQTFKDRSFAVLKKVMT